MACFKYVLYGRNALETGVRGWTNVIKTARFEREQYAKTSCFKHIFGVRYSAYTSRKPFYCHVEV